MRVARLSSLFMIVLMTAWVVAMEARQVRVAADPPAPMISLAVDVVDADTGKAIPCRVYLQAADGKYHFVQSAEQGGSAVRYDVNRFNGKSIERHTTVSAHRFGAQLPEGRYTLTIERGKEYIPATMALNLKRDANARFTVRLRRWFNAPAHGWWSGETHVHRALADLSNLLLAEDLNVALPLTAWVTQSHTPPTAGDKNAERVAPKLIRVDDTHVIWPMNTEYEIFSVRGKRHTLGAVFVLNHKQPLEMGAPPVGPIADAARRQGALLDLDKHCWPWSLMLVPVMKVNLYELANNHVWRTRFGFTQWYADQAPAYLNAQRDEHGLTERGWLDFGFETYYALLNCGFDLKPTAGAASGVHPVPLGFGRVYVKLDGDFSYDKWMKGLAAGRSFVTTGPMLMTTVAGSEGGGAIELAQPDSVRVVGAAHSAVSLSTIEILVNGEVVRRLTPKNEKTKQGGFESRFDEQINVDSSAWIAVRCFEDRPDGRVRFAHSSPVRINIPDRPLRPRREQIEYLVAAVRNQIEQHKAVLDEQEMKEFHEALRIYESHLEHAK